jgi:hypothetical protein
MRRDVRYPNRSWRVDKTLIKVAGQWKYLSIDSRKRWILLLSLRIPKEAPIFLCAPCGGVPAACLGVCCTPMRADNGHNRSTKPVCRTASKIKLNNANGSPSSACGDFASWQVNPLLENEADAVPSQARFCEI